MSRKWFSLFSQTTCFILGRCKRVLTGIDSRFLFSIVVMSFLITKTRGGFLESETKASYGKIVAWWCLCRSSLLVRYSGMDGKIDLVPHSIDITSRYNCLCPSFIFLAPME